MALVFPIMQREREIIFVYVRSLYNHTHIHTHAHAGNGGLAAFFQKGAAVSPYVACTG